MALMKCPSCGDLTSLKVGDATASGYNYPLIVIQCNMCSCVLGVLPKTDLTAFANRTLNELADLGKQIKAVTASVAGMR